MLRVAPVNRGAVGGVGGGVYSPQLVHIEDSSSSRTETLVHVLKYHRLVRENASW